MRNILRLSRKIRMTYRVNSILYSLGRLPVLGHLMPENPHLVRKLTHAAEIGSVLWEVLKLFGGKFLYFLLLGWAWGAEPSLPTGQVYLFRLLLMTLGGMMIHTGFAGGSFERYYAVNLMRMNAHSYTISHFWAEMAKGIVGFLPASLLLGWVSGVELWFNLLVPFCIAGGKITVMALELWYFETHDGAVAQWKTLRWGCAAALLMLAWLLPMYGAVPAADVSMGLLGAMVPLGLLSFPKMFRFRAYRELNRQLLADFFDGVRTVTNPLREGFRNLICEASGISSAKTGFAYLNDLFVQRHRKLLWKATWRISAGCILVFGGGMILLGIVPGLRPGINRQLLQLLPYCSFLLYRINRGTSITRALFVNCDHSLLTYSFYKQPEAVLELFRIRLWEIVKINAVPAALIGLGLDGILLVSGGGSWIEYVIVPVTILSMSLFFSIHCLTLYYLLQPFRADTEIKSGTYQFVTAGTWFGCCLLMQLQIPAVSFGLLCIGFCAVYGIIACALVYRVAPVTFRLCG